MELGFDENEEITLVFSSKNERIIGHLIKITADHADGIEEHIAQEFLLGISQGLSSDTGSGRISGSAKDIALILKFSDAFSTNLIFDFGRNDFLEDSENYGFVTLVDGLQDRLPEAGVAEFTFREIFEQGQWIEIAKTLAGYARELPPAFGFIAFENVRA